MSLIPKFGEVFSYNEEKYNISKDDFQVAYISCPNKSLYVTAPLSTGLQMGIQSRWEDLFGGGITGIAGSLLDTINNIEQLTKGYTIQQPWMTRKQYKSTEPITFNLTLSFVAETSALSEVWTPNMALMAMVAPRYTETKWNSMDITPGRTGGLVDSIKGAFNEYIVPGPSPTSGISGLQSGDAVSLTVGKITFNYCCIESAQPSFSDVIASDGYPISCETVLSIRTRDTPIVKNNTFLISQVNDVSGFSGMVKGFVDTAKTTVTELSNMAGYVTGFYKGE